MQPDATPIQAALRRQQAHVGPRVVRLVGAGAWNAASRWVEAQGAEAEVAFPFLPEEQEGTVWLHDAPGSRYLADILAAHCVLHDRRWTLLLTGRATDGAHPSHGETLEISALTRPGAGRPTRVLLAVPEDPEEALARHLDRGEIAWAHALYEQLTRSDPSARAGCSVELLRLIRVGRATEVEGLATTLPGRERHPGELLFAMAEAALELNTERARLYLDALRARGGTAEEAADLVFLQALADRDMDGMRTHVPHTTRHRVLRRRILQTVGEGVAGPSLPGALAAAVEAYDELPVRAFLALGDLAHAATLARRAGGDVGAAYLQNGDVEEGLAATRRALEAGDIEAARAHLARVEARAPRQQSGQAFYALVYAARVAAHQANVGWLHAIEARLRVFEGRMWASTALVELLVPVHDPPADPWCRVTLLRLLKAWSRGSVEVLEQALAALPERPIVLGPYVLEEVIASGGMGTVWRGQHRLTRRPVAVKVLDQATPTAVRLFRAEIDVVTRFDHPMIVSVLDLLEVDDDVERQSGQALRCGQPALVMELVAHGTLADHVGSLGWEDIRDALVGILEALAYAHAHGVVHRDLKPQNILVGEGNALRLADFGLADLDQGKVAGTPTYMAPEQFGRGKVGPAADVYAAGCIAWTLACGLPPFFGSAKQLAAAHASAPLPAFEPMLPVPAGFEDWLHRCLAKEPSARFPSAAAAAEALLALGDEGGDLPGRAPVGPLPGRSSTTFVLQTLLDLPDHVFEPIEEGTATRRLHDIFEDRASWRPRIPTHRLLHKGEPPVLFQRDAQRELWTTLMNALGGRAQRIELHGRGGEPILRWLRRRARLAGLLVHEEPVRGHVSIVDATDLAPDDVPVARRERWVFVWRDREVPGARRIDLRPFDPGAIWWIVTSRILLHPQTACWVALEAGGSPDVAFALVDDWLENPGMEMTERGLRLLRVPDEPGARAVAQWKSFLARSRPERIHLAELMAVKPFASSGDFLREASGLEELRLESMATPCNGAWRLPDALQAAVLEPLDEQAIRALHRLSAEHERQPAARVIHACLADPTLENTEAMLEVLRDTRMPRKLLDLVQIPINCHLLEARETRARWKVRQLSDAAVARHLMDPDPLVADQARLEHIERRAVWPDAVARAVEEQLLDDRRPSMAIRLAQGLATHLLRQGRLDHALACVDRLGAHLQGHPDHLPHLLAWARARCLSGETAVRAYQDALVGAPIAVAPTLHIDLADELLQLHRYPEALHHLDASLGIWSLAADYNRALALLALERDAEATEITGRLTSSAMVNGKPAFFIGLLYADLFLHLDEPTPMWEALLALAVPIRDPQMKQVLLHRLDRVSPTPRSERLRRELDGRPG